MRVVVENASEYIGRWVAARTLTTYEPDDTAIGLLDPARGLLAGVLYQNFNGVNISVHIAAEPGSSWLTRGFLWKIFHYPFEQLGAQRLTGFVPATNLAAQRFDEHLGFTEEARLSDALPSGDLIIYRMRKSECRWLALKERYNGE